MESPWWSVCITCSAREFGSRVVGMKDGVLVFDSLMSAVDDAMLRDLYGEASDER